MRNKQNRKYHIITIGCQMNKSDSERLASCLEGLGFRESGKRDQADLVFLNTCGVRQSAEDRVYGLIPKIKRENPEVKIILTGCLSNRSDVKERLKEKVDLWLPIINLPKLNKYLVQLFQNGKAVEISNFSSPGEYLAIKPKLNSNFSAFVPIGNGCDNYCTYCVVPYARGGEVYREAEKILQEVKDFVSRGYKEITLIAQNVNSYKSGKKDFADLLAEVNKIKGDFWIRFATSHPKDMGGKLIEVIAKSEKVCPHIHLPAQSGDGEILRNMNRKYTCEQYLDLISQIRKNCDHKKMIGEKEDFPASLSTDIIVGFPGETDEQFKNTKKLFHKAEFDLAYISQYSPRFGTAAAQWKDDVPQKVKKEREEKLIEILKKTALKNNRAYKNKQARVLVEGKNKQGDYYGKTCTYKNVKIKSSAEKLSLGSFIEVKITQVRDFGLEGELKNPEP